MNAAKNEINRYMAMKHGSGTYLHLKWDGTDYEKSTGAKQWSDNDIVPLMQQIKKYNKKAGDNMIAPGEFDKWNLEYVTYKQKEAVKNNMMSLNVFENKTTYAGKTGKEIKAMTPEVFDSFMEKWTIEQDEQYPKVVKAYQNAYTKAGDRDFWEKWAKQNRRDSGYTDED